MKRGGKTDLILIIQYHEIFLDGKLWHFRVCAPLIMSAKLGPDNFNFGCFLFRRFYVLVNMV